MKRAFVNWSSGKDAALALYQLQQDEKYAVEKLVTTLNTDLQRISMHGLRRELLIAQVESLQIPLQLIPLAGNVSMQTYNERMEAATGELLAEGFTHSVFGDIFLEDLKEYREQQLAKVGLKGIFPLWKKPTAEVMEQFLELGFRAITVCVNARLLDKSFCGRIIDEDFLNDLPEGVDACGENGEFHTFVFDGPNFAHPVEFEIGEVVERSFQPAGSQKKDDCFSDRQESWDTGFWYCDLLKV